MTDHRYKLVHKFITLVINGGTYLILSDSEVKPFGNEPALYHRSYFTITDPTKPAFWICEIENGEMDCFPPEWNSDYFEEYYNRVETAKIRFWCNFNL